MYKKCPGSGELYMLSWLPDDKGYPGAVICQCTFGVLVVKGSTHEATSQSGFKGYAGKVRVHYINEKEQVMSYKKIKEEK